jgi:hypothetical protein
MFDHLAGYLGVTIMRVLALAIVLLLAFASSTHASKEGILAFSSFRLESNGIGSSGKITVEGKQNDKAQINENTSATTEECLCSTGRFDRVFHHLVGSL